LALVLKTRKCKGEQTPGLRPKEKWRLHGCQELPLSFASHCFPLCLSAISQENMPVVSECGLLQDVRLHRYHARGAQATGPGLHHCASPHPQGTHQLVAVVENVTCEDPAGSIHHRLLHDVVMAGGRGYFQPCLGTGKKTQRGQLSASQRRMQETMLLALLLPAGPATRHPPTP
jgi:hypothetical protein